MLRSCFNLYTQKWQQVANAVKSVAFSCLLVVLVLSKAYASEPYSIAQIQAERLELDNIISQDRANNTKAIDERIAAVSADPARLAALYLMKAYAMMHSGLPGIEENLLKATPLIDEKQHPELILFAMSLKAYGLYVYQNRAEEAVEILEQVLQNPALNNDFFVQVNSLSNLLEAYYKLKRYDKISKPLFKLVRILSAKDIDPNYRAHFPYIEEELAYHSREIGDIEQAIKIYKKHIASAELANQNENIAVIYCNIANAYFLPLPEKIQYAKASLAAKNDTPCSDVMKKLVILDEIKHGNLANVASLAEFDTKQQMLRINERSAYYAGLAYLQLNDLTSVQQMLTRMKDVDNWERYDLLQQLYEKQGDFKQALTANQKYHQLRAQKDEDARRLMLSSYQTRLELAQEDTKVAEEARQAEQLAAAEQKAQFRLQLILALICSGTVVILVLTVYLYRSRRMQQQLQRLSDTDPLTGLLNRRAFLRHAEQLKLLAERQNFPLSVALIDLDFFKQINDKHGHLTGDLVLCAFVDAAKTTLRQTDIIGRVGGEEFILISTHDDDATFAALLQRLQQTFAQMCLQDINIGINVSFSAGIARIHTPDAQLSISIEAAVRLADEQMYRAKANGRQQVCSEKSCIAF